MVTGLPALTGHYAGQGGRNGQVNLFGFDSSSVPWKISDLAPNFCGISNVPIFFVGDLVVAERKALGFLFFAGRVRRFFSDLIFFARKHRIGVLFGSLCPSSTSGWRLSVDG